MARKSDDLQPHWTSKTCAGAVLGFTLALALSGLFAWLGPGGIASPGKDQFNMWMVTPMWLTVFSLVYLFRTGLRAWLWLGGLNALVFAALFLTRHLMGG